MPQKKETGTDFYTFVQKEYNRTADHQVYDLPKSCFLTKKCLFLTFKSTKKITDLSDALP
jgi:hypothetical protein